MHLVCQQKGVLLCKLVFHGREDGVIPEIQMFYPFFFGFTLSFRAFTRVASEQRSHCVASLLDNSPRSQWFVLSLALTHHLKHLSGLQKTLEIILEYSSWRSPRHGGLCGTGKRWAGTNWEQDAARHARLVYQLIQSHPVASRMPS